MKVAINARFLLPRLEGIGHYTHEIAQQLALKHPEDEFHLILDREIWLPLMKLPNVEVHVLSPPARHPILWSIWYEIQIPKLLDKIQADVFFSPDGYLSLGTSVPTVLTIHDLAYKDFPQGSNWLHRKYLEYFMPKYVEHAKAIVAVSQFTAESISKNFPDVQGKVTVIPNGLTDGFKSISIEQQQIVRNQVTGGRPYFLYLGAMHPRKNVGRLIEAFTAYKSTTDDEVCLILAGRFAWQTSNIEQQLVKSEYADDILHLSDFDKQITDLVASASALCYISLLEGFGLPVLEAMACGTPVITSCDSAMAEVGGKTAHYVDPMDISDIVSKMNMVRSRHVFVNECSEKGIIRARQFTWEKSSKKLHELFSKGVH